ncbi:hypothetical protein AGLY_005581 [Aphis glycines]|uniref:Uncharacterized protein n=1 Tax=Aphis glycines TaxID=307491 RepID=A0A6G0TT79_APHGL|nr:hypothetical protein AGLY_005581 [Aphis glycines]
MVIVCDPNHHFMYLLYVACASDEFTITGSSIQVLRSNDVMAGCILEFTIPAYLFAIGTDIITHKCNTNYFLKDRKCPTVIGIFIISNTVLLEMLINQHTIIYYDLPFWLLDIDLSIEAVNFLYIHYAIVIKKKEWSSEYNVLPYSRSPLMDVLNLNSMKVFGSCESLRVRRALHLANKN